MLSEVWQLAEALESVGQSPERTHPRVKSPGKTTGPCLRIRLRQDGTVGAVESLAEDEWPGLWTIMEGNMNSFPVVRLTQPLLRLPPGHRGWTQLGFNEKGKRKKTERPSDSFSILGDLWNETEKTEASDTWKRMAEKASELEACGGGSNPPNRQVLGEFGKRFIAAALNPDELLRQIAMVSLEAWKKGVIQGSAQDAVEGVLVGAKPPKGEEPIAETKVQLAFDLYDDHELPVRLYSLKIRRHLIEVLPQKSSEEQVEAAPVICSFSGLREHRQDGPFPKVRLPVLNKDFPLFSMFSDAACNARYGLTNSEAVPVANSTANRLADALTYITREDRKGYDLLPKNWSM